jgi:hypothetical protein
VRLPLLLALLLLAVACAGPEEGPDVLDEQAAAALGAGADQLAAALDADDDCGAMAEADALVERAADGVEAGLVPGDVAAEIEAVADETTGDLECTGDDLDGSDDAEGPDGNGEPPEAPEPEIEEAPEPDTGPDEGRGGGRGGGRDDAPGQARGAGGPPGQEAHP